MYNFVEQISETYILPALLGFLILMWIIDFFYKPYGKKPRKASKLEKKIVSSKAYKTSLKGFQTVLFIIFGAMAIAILIGLIGPGGGGWLQP